MKENTQTDIHVVNVEKFRAIAESRMGKALSLEDVAVIHDRNENAPVFEVKAMSINDTADLIKGLGLDLNDVKVVHASDLDKDPEIKKTNKFKK